MIHSGRCIYCIQLSTVKHFLWNLNHLHSCVCLVIDSNKHMWDILPQGYFYWIFCISPPFKSLPTLCTCIYQYLSPSANLLTSWCFEWGRFEVLHDIALMMTGPSTDLLKKYVRCSLTSVSKTSECFKKFISLYVPLSGHLCCFDNSNSNWCYLVQ